MLITLVSKERPTHLGMFSTPTHLLPRDATYDQDTNMRPHTKEMTS